MGGRDGKLADWVRQSRYNDLPSQRDLIGASVLVRAGDTVRLWSRGQAAALWLYAWPAEPRFCATRLGAYRSGIGYREEHRGPNEAGLALDVDN